MQRGGAFTPVRRRPSGGGSVGGGSKNPSPYTRNSSGKKIGGTPGSSVGSAKRNGGSTNLY